jgi:hypothetical protein
MALSREEIVSERFIHNDLLRQAEAAVRTVYGIWRRERKITPTLITWPAERIRTEQGEPHEGVCLLELPEGNEKRSEAILAMVRRTKAYGLLLIEQKPDEVRAIFETRHGARCWQIPLVTHGDVVLLGRAEVREDALHVGLLWSPTIGQG